MITFYDIPSSLPKKAWSPNTWKTRYSLNYKGLEYKTEWVEYPEIEALSKRLGIPPTDYRPDGSPYYSLPVIHDPSTGVSIADSIEIAKYLDKTYPDTPKLIPEGTEGFHYAFLSAFDAALDPMWQFIVPQTTTYLHPRSEEYFIRTKTPIFGWQNLRWEDVVPKGEAREKAWGDVRKGFSSVEKWFAKNGGKGMYIMGETISFADFVVAGYMLWFKLSWGEESPEWKDIKSWDDGRWAKLVDEFKKYGAVH